MTTARRFTVRRFPEYGWAVMDDGEKIGDEFGPWWPTRKRALAEADRREHAAVDGGQR